MSQLQSSGTKWFHLCVESKVDGILGTASKVVKFLYLRVMDR